MENKQILHVHHCWIWNLSTLGKIVMIQVFNCIDIKIKIYKN